MATDCSSRGGGGASTACVVNGLRLAVAAASPTTTLRPVFRVDRFGGSWGPVLPLPPPPGAWAEGQHENYVNAAAAASAAEQSAESADYAVVGRCTLNQVDP
jgi:hypothetical protein